MNLYIFDYKFEDIGKRLDYVRSLDQSSMSQWAKEHWQSVESYLLKQWKRTVSDYDQNCNEKIYIVP